MKSSALLAALVAMVTPFGALGPAGTTVTEGLSQEPSPSVIAEEDSLTEVDLAPVAPLADPLLPYEEPTKTVEDWDPSVAFESPKLEGEELPAPVLSVDEGISVASLDSKPFGVATLEVVNDERTKAGLSQLKLLVALQDYAQWYSQTWDAAYAQCGAIDFGDCHMDSLLGNGSASYRREAYRSQGWSRGADLLGRGFTSEVSVANAWLNSPGHRKWLMDGNGKVEAIGVGRAGNSWTLWVVGGALTNPTPNMKEVLPVGKPAAERLSGQDRYKTSLAVAKKTAKSGKPLFIATGKDFPDALSVSPAVRQEDGTLLLVGNSLTSEAGSFLSKTKPSHLYVIGGSGAVSTTLANQVAQASGVGSNVTRVAGVNRYETSREIMKKFFPNSRSGFAFIATGTNYPDALSASAAGGIMNSPVLLAGSGAELSRTLSDMKKTGVREVRTVGGTGVISPRTQNEIGKVFASGRLAGSDRYGTNAAVNRFLDGRGYSSAIDLWIATGSGFPDALSAGAPAGQSGSRLILARKTCIPAWASATVGLSKQAYLVGGTGVLGVPIETLQSCAS